MSDKALLSRAELELTQRLQLHFPCGEIPPKMQSLWNGCSCDRISLALTEILNRKPASFSPYLRRTAGKSLIIPECDGGRTFANSESVFECGLGYDFPSGAQLVVKKPTPATIVDVYDLVKEAMAFQMFDSLSHNLEDLILTENQIIEFSVRHTKRLLAGGFNNFFLLKEDEDKPAELGNLLLARVRVYPNGLCALVDTFMSYYAVPWGCDPCPRVVVPQLAA